MQSELKPRPLSEAAAATAEINDGGQLDRVVSRTSSSLSSTDSMHPLLRRPKQSQSFTNRRQLSLGADSFAAGAASPPLTQSIRRDVSVAAAETFVITQLAVALLTYLGSLSAIAFAILTLLSMVGYRWILKFLALGCYAMLLMPGFIQVGYYYFFSSQVWRSLVYGEQPRNRLDLYVPKDTSRLKPVVIFVTGGAWIIGYKAWGSLLGKRLAERGILVACIDYRNFPQGTISDMVKDVSEGISFVCNYIEDYGGDPNRIYLMGQSAGAHIAACALVHQAIKEHGGETITWSVSQIRAYFGSSGGDPLVISESTNSLDIGARFLLACKYNLENLVDHFHKRGLYKSIFFSIMEGEKSLQHYSPEIIVRNPDVKDAVSKLPPAVLFHGTADYSIPSSASKSFADALRSIGIHVRLVLYEGKTHTDLFLQDPLRGGKDELLEEVISVVNAGDSDVLDENALKLHARRLVPEWMLQLAREVSPF